MATRSLNGHLSAQQGGDMVASSPAAFAEFILAERKRYETIVRDAGMTVE